MAYVLKDQNEKPVLRNGEKVYVSDLVAKDLIKSVNMDKRELIIRGTDETRDRDGDIIEAGGWDLDNFVKNPVFLWAHDYGSVPLAGAKRVIKKRVPFKGLLFVEKFPTEGLYPFADMILQLYKEKIINASSVGFRPQKSEPIDDQEEDAPDAFIRGGRRFLKQELLELSGCAVPSNPSALQNSVKDMGFEELGKYLLKSGIPEPKNKDDIEEEIYKSTKEVEIVDEDSDSTSVSVEADLPNDREEKEDEVINTVLTDEEKDNDKEEKEENEEVNEEKINEIENKLNKIEERIDTIGSSLAKLVENLEKAESLVSVKKPERDKSDGSENLTDEERERQKYEQIMTMGKQKTKVNKEAITEEQIKTLTRSLNVLVKRLPEMINE